MTRAIRQRAVREWARGRGDDYSWFANLRQARRGACGFGRAEGVRELRSVGRRRRRRLALGGFAIAVPFPARCFALGLVGAAAGLLLAARRHRLGVVAAVPCRLGRSTGAEHQRAEQPTQQATETRTHEVQDTIGADGRWEGVGAVTRRLPVRH